MSNELAAKFSDMDMQGVDVTDAGVIAQMMGYNDPQEGAPAAPQVPATLQGDTTTAAPAPAAPAVESSAPPAAATEQPGDIAGVLTKDGKHVIPHRVLQEARYSASLERQRAADLAAQNDALTKQIEALKSGAQQPHVAADKLAEIETDFPQLQPLIEAVRAQQKQAHPEQTAQVKTPEQQAMEETTHAASLDAAIAPLPILSKYRDLGGVVWGRAVEIDSALMDDPSFRDADLASRLAEVEKRMAAELGITPQPAATPAAPAQATQAKAPTQAPQPTQILPTLTDLSGGGVSVGDPLAGMTSGQMVDKAMNMDMESLRRMAGLSY